MKTLTTTITTLVCRVALKIRELIVMQVFLRFLFILLSKNLRHSMIAVFKLLTPKGDQYVTSHYNIHTLSCKQVMRIL